MNNDDDTLALGLPAINKLEPLRDASQKTVLRLCKSGEIPAIRIGGRWAIRPSRLVRHLRDLEDAALARGAAHSEAGQ